MPAKEVEISDGWLQRRSDPTQRESVSAPITRAGGHAIEARASARPGKERKQYAMHAFGAVFAEVHVDPDLGEIRVHRIVASYGVGRLLNRKTAHSQLKGGIIWGIGMALHEKTELDPVTERVANANLAEYHVPVNADVGTIDAGAYWTCRLRWTSCWTEARPGPGWLRWPPSNGKMSPTGLVPAT